MDHEKGMLVLAGNPKNREHFHRLLILLREVVEICAQLNLSPMLSGSLAVLAYTHQADVEVHDIDLFIAEAEFPRLIRAFEDNGIDCRLREWHVIHVLRDDLKLDFDSVEYWMKDLPANEVPLQIGDFRLTIVSLNCLRTLYQRGLDAMAGKLDASSRMKHADLEAKIEALRQVNDLEFR